MIAPGLLGAALAGAIDALVGTAMEHAEHAMANGIAKDESVVYETALRQRKTLLIVLPNDGAQAAAAREVLGGADPMPYAAMVNGALGLRRRRHSNRS